MMDVCGKMPNTNKHPQTTWHIEQEIKDKIKIIGKRKGVNAVATMARIILVEYIVEYESQNGKIELESED